MICDAVVEDPRGATERHVWDEVAGTWRTYQHPYATRPWPASYGFLQETWNPVDQDPLDVIILATPPLPTGTCLRVRPVGLLRRPDGDDKILAVAIDDPAYADVRWLAEVPHSDLAAIEAWFRDWSDAGAWEDAAAAERLIRDSRAPGAGWPRSCKV